MAELMEDHEDDTTEQTDSQTEAESRELQESYAQLGLQPGTAMRDIEAAYWQFARDLRGQTAITPYTAPYEALVNRVKPRVTESREPPALPTEKPERTASKPSSPGAKFGWPAT